MIAGVCCDCCACCTSSGRVFGHSTSFGSILFSFCDDLVSVSLLGVILILRPRFNVGSSSLWGGPEDSSLSVSDIVILCKMGDACCVCCADGKDSVGGVEFSTVDGGADGIGELSLEAFNSFDEISESSSVGVDFIRRNRNLAGCIALFGS